MIQTLKSIIGVYGLDILKDGNKLLAYYSDLAPMQKRERQMLEYLVKCDGHITLMNALYDTKDEQTRKMKQLVDRMVAQVLVSEDIAETVCKNFWESIGGMPIAWKQPKQTPTSYSGSSSGQNSNTQPTGGRNTVTANINKIQGNTNPVNSKKSLPKLALAGIAAAVVLAVVLLVVAISGRSSNNGTQPVAYPNEISDTKVEETTLPATCSLYDVPLLKTTYDSRDVGTYEDKLGNSYPNSLYYDYGYSDDVDIYVLSKEYSTLSGTIFVPDTRGSHDDETSGLRVIIYGDDKRIYTSSQMQPTSYPVDFYVDVRGVNQLKVYYEGGASTWRRPIALTNLTLTRSTNSADKNYVSKVPMRLLDLPELKNDFICHTNVVRSDLQGNTYADCIVFLWGYSDDEAIYALQGKYSKLTGTVFVPSCRYADDNPADMYYVRIYGDGELLYTSPQMLYNSKPASFELDVNGIQQLKIMYEGGAMTWEREIGLDSLFLYE